MFLERTAYLKTGIWGKLITDDKVYVTLEHAFINPKADGFRPILQSGVYPCVRGMHQLKRMSVPFETFEITNVPGHTGILFHVGNFNGDSEGCVLLGNSSNTNQLFNSADAFTAFMKSLKGINSFNLRVE